jgi:hypothetical protein
METRRKKNWRMKMKTKITMKMKGRGKCRCTTYEVCQWASPSTPTTVSGSTWRK